MRPGHAVEDLRYRHRLREAGESSFRRCAESAARPSPYSQLSTTGASVSGCNIQSANAYHPTTAAAAVHPARLIDFRLAPLLTYPLYSETNSSNGIALISTESHTMRQVAFHRPSMGPDEEREVLDTLRSGWITTGPKAKRFETEFAGYVGAKHALAVSHCTGALHLSLWALGIGPGDEVITTPFTFTATAEILGYLGARPVFVDVDPGTFNINPARIEEALESGAQQRVRAILPVHFAGHACDMDRILNIARNYNLKVVEDAAHAAGSARHMDGRGMAKIGTIGDLTCFSFYATKNFTTAEGGMITTGDDALAEKIAVASLHGMNKDAWKRYDKSGSWYYEIHDMGFKYNLSDVHAAIGLAQLKRADDFMRRRGRNRARLQRSFPQPTTLFSPRTPSPASSTPGISTCCASARNA